MVTVSLVKILKEHVQAPENTKETEQQLFQVSSSSSSSSLSYSSETESYSDLFLYSDNTNISQKSQKRLVYVSLSMQQNECTKTKGRLLQRFVTYIILKKTFQKIIFQSKKFNGQLKKKKLNHM